MSEFLIATSVLEAIVRGSLEKDERFRLHSVLPLVRSHPIEVTVDQDGCQVTVQLDVRMGEHLPRLAGDVRRAIADSLNPMTGLVVSAVDVVFGGVFPSEV